VDDLNRTIRYPSMFSEKVMTATLSWIILDNV